MNSPRLSLLLISVLVVPEALVVGAAGPAAAAPPNTTFGSHVSSCAQMSTGFSGQHNPSHHRRPVQTPFHDCGTSHWDSFGSGAASDFLLGQCCTVAVNGPALGS